MFNLLRLVDDNFDDKNLGDADLRSFTEDFLVRLAQPENNPGSIYSTMLSDTSTKYTAYYGKMTSRAVKDAIAEGTTITRNNARKDVEDKISNLQNLTIYKFKETSSQYQELYPLGIMEYTRAKEGDIGTLFDRFVTAATTHLDTNFHDDVVEVSGLVTAFHNAYTARETVVSQVDVLITGKNSDRKALTIQLTQNFLIIASNNIGNPDKFDDYYDARFLPIVQTGTIVRSVKITVAPGMVGNFDVSQLGLNFDKILTIAFKTKDSIGKFYGGETANSEPGATFITVQAISTVILSAADAQAQMGSDGTHTFLNVKNTGTAASDYTLTFTQQE